MKRSPRPVRPTLWSAAALCAVAAHCGGSAPLQTQTLPPPPPPHPVAAAPQVDLSEVAAPAEMTALIRVASVNAVIERVGQLTGLGTQLRAGADELLGNLAGDADVSALMDRAQPLDVLWYGRPHASAAMVVSFGGPSVDQIETQLANTHRLIPLTNGVLRLERNGAQGRPSQEQSEIVAGGPFGGAMRCVAAPTPTAGRTRVACSESDDALMAALPFLSRTLTRRELPGTAISVELGVTALRTMYGAETVADLDRERARSLNEINAASTPAPWNTPPTRQALSRLANDLFDNLRSVLNDTSALGVTITLDAQRVSGHLVVDLRAPAGSVIRASSEALRGGGQVPPELLAHLLPDGLLYVAGAGDLRPFRAIVGEVNDLAVALLEQEHSLRPADIAAVRAAIETASMLAPVAGAMGLGYDDQGEMWGAGTYRLTDAQPAAVVAAYRTVVSTLRRPAVVRLANNALRAATGPQMLQLVNFADLRELPTTGLPPGSYAFATPTISGGGAMWATMRPPTPPPTGPGARPGRPARAPRRVPTQMILVPSGQDLIVAFGPNARDVYTRYQANATPGIDPAQLRVQGSPMAMALVPAAFPNSLRAVSAQASSGLAQGLAQLPDHGRTPIAVRMSSSESDGAVRFTADGELSGASVAMLAMFVLMSP